MSITLSDLKYALRLLRKSPWFTVLTILVLTGGLGISIYTFAALNTVIYRDLPLPDGGSIVTVQAGAWPDFEPLDAYELAHLRSEATTLTELGVYRRSRVLIGERGSTRNIAAVEADWRIFDFTRTPPLLGRGFVSDDSVESAEPVAVLSFETWQSAFAADPDVAGKLARINGTLTRIVGVMPERYAFPTNAQLWLPLAQAFLDPADYTGTRLSSYARLRPGVPADAVATELTGLLQRLRLEFPGGSEQEVEAVSVSTFQEESWGILGTMVFSVLNLLSVSILLLAAVNVGNLLLVRTNERIREIGVRIALGAPRLRLIVQTTLENILLCAIGGVLAVLFAARALEASDDFMQALLGQNMPFWWRWSLDEEIVTAAGVLLLLTVLVVSVLPAMCVGSVDPNTVLRDGARGTRGLRTGRISRWLVTIQVALISAVMAVGGAVAIIADRAANFDFGMNIENLLMMSVRPPADTYTTNEDRLNFYERLLGELRNAPGIEAAAVLQEQGVASFATADAGFARSDEYPIATLATLSESRTPIGPTLIQGRSFDSRDNATGVKTAIVSETLAATYWPNESPLGRRIEVFAGEAETEERTVVGVVGDVRYDPIGISRMGLAAIYLPLPQHVLQTPRFIVRHFGDGAQASDSMYEALARVAPDVPPGNVVSYTETLAQMTLFARTMTKLFTGCGAFAILLAITGIYGISSNSVVLRSPEIGLRRALGASDGNVIAIFLVQGGRQLAVGLALSIALSALVLAAISRGFAVGAGTLGLIGAAVIAVVSMVVLLSIYVSVRRVVRLEPSAVLRHG